MFHFHEVYSKMKLDILITLAKPCQQVAHEGLRKAHTGKM